MRTVPSPFSIHSIDFNSTPQDARALRSAYDEHGIVYLRSFLSPHQLEQVTGDLRVAEAQAFRELAEKWGNQKIVFFSRNPVNESETKDSENYVVTPYFQQSDRAAHIFFEEIDQRLVVNRIGHGLHLQRQLPALEKLIYGNSALNDSLRALGYRHPICHLSVYIPKFPNGIGSEVKPHQESTFANTDPLSAIVLWVALEDATIENACMWGLPGSHRLPLKYVSKVDHEKPARTYVRINEVAIPEFDEAPSAYVPLEVRAGDAILFHGNFVHCSPRNVSGNSRKALSFQFLETAGATYSDFNWIKNPNSKTLY